MKYRIEVRKTLNDIHVFTAMSKHGLQPPLRLSAVEFRKRLKGGLSLPPLVVAVEDESDREHLVVLKVLKPDRRCEQFGGASLASELICSTIARAMGMCVPDYAIVNIQKAMAHSIQDGEARELFLANIGPHFGSVFIHDAASPDFGLMADSLIDEAEDILAFDAAMINGDRTAKKPNLLLRSRQIYMIDHALAGAAVYKNDNVEPSFVIPESYVYEHCMYRCLAQKGKKFIKLFDLWRDRLSASDWAMLRTWIPDAWYNEKGAIDKLFHFLSERGGCLEPTTDSLRLVVK